MFRIKLNNVWRQLSKRRNHTRFFSTSSQVNNSSSKLIPNTLIFAGGVLSGSLLYAYKSENTIDVTPKLKDQNNFNSTLQLEQLDSPVYASDEEIEVAIDEIREIVRPINVENTQDLITKNQEVLDSHSDSYFNSHHPTPEERPKYVVYPQSTEQVSKVMAVCHKYKVPVVPITGGSSLEGHFIPTRGGISLDLSGMDRIINLNKSDLDMHVEAGVGWELLADYLEPHGLMFGPDPGPGADIGGMCATNCSGTNASKYGECYKNILSLTVVLADGTIIKTKNRPRKSSAGYNLNSLFIGSEGTLGIITEATLKLHVLPANEAVAVVPFASIADASKAVNSLVLSGINLNAIELLDDNMMACINKSGETSRHWQEAPTLFIKVGGSSKVIVDTLIGQIKQVFEKNHCKDFLFAQNEDEKEELWAARKVALWSTINQGKLKNDKIQLWTTDTAVPLSHLPEYLVETKKDIDSEGLQNTLVAHIGDGNAHAFILYDSSERKKANDVVGRMVQRALQLGGTCTGEHGVGFGKRDFLLEEIGEKPIDLMRKIKLSLDPHRILNPDKIFKIDPNEPLENHGSEQPDIEEKKINI